MGRPSESGAGGAAERPRARREGLSAEVVGADYVLHDARTGQVHFMNETAALVWELADGSRSLDELCAFVARRYGRPAQDVRVDVVQILATMRGEGLLEADGP